MPAEEKEKIMQVGDISPVVLLCMCIVYNVCRYCRLENFLRWKIFVDAPLQCISETIHGLSFHGRWLMAGTYACAQCSID